MLFIEDGGRPPKHVGVKMVLFLYMLCVCKLLVVKFDVSVSVRH